MLLLLAFFLLLPETHTPHTDRQGDEKSGRKIQSSVCVFAGIFLSVFFPHRRIPCHIFFTRDLLACHRTVFQAEKKSRRQGIIVFCLAVKGRVGAKRRSATEPGDEVRLRHPLTSCRRRGERRIWGNKTGRKDFDASEDDGEGKRESRETTLGER